MGFHERYSEEEREALAAAYADRRIRPARRVVELAAAGELEHNGQRLDPFEASESSVRGLASKRSRRRAGQVPSRLAAVDPGDAVEVFRRQLVAVAEHGITQLE